MNGMTRRSIPYLAAAFLLAAAPAGAEPAQAEADPSLETAIREFLDKPELVEDRTTRYVAYPVDLDGDGVDEQVVYVTGIRWCGSGGCTTLVARRAGASYEIVSRIRVTETPVHVLDAAPGAGWRSLAVPVTGAGPRPSYVAELPFDGTGYPENPTASEARPLSDVSAAQVVVPSVPGEGRLLYAP